MNSGSTTPMRKTVLSASYFKIKYLDDKFPGSKYCKQKQEISTLMVIISVCNTMHKSRVQFIDNSCNTNSKMVYQINKQFKCDIYYYRCSCVILESFTKICIEPKY